MSLIVEDGTGLVNAESYASVAEADAYFASRGVTDWKNPDTAKEIQTLTLSSGASGNGNVTITLDGVAFVVPVTSGSATHVCAEIRAFAFAGWSTGGNDGFVIFTATKAETRDGAYSFVGGTTGAAGIFVESQAGNDAVKESALIRATSAVDGLMGSRWPGLRETQDQVLDWPRAQAWDRDGWPLTGLPRAVKTATIEAALVELNTAGALTEAQSRGGQILREKVGPIETEYAKGAPASTVYPAIIQPLSRIVRGGGGIVTERG